MPYLTMLMLLMYYNVDARPPNVMLKVIFIIKGQEIFPADYQVGRTNLPGQIFSMAVSPSKSVVSLLAERVMRC